MIDSPPTYNADYGYKSWEAYSDLSQYTRTLPPVPEDCPTPMGVVGECAFSVFGETSFLRFLNTEQDWLGLITSRVEIKHSAGLTEWKCAEGTQ